MPYKMHKRGSQFQVVNEDTGKKYSKGTTKKKAEAQERLLRAVEHGWKPSKRRK